MTVIYFLLLLTVIICIHELGHLLAAKLFGVYCYEFSFGMGPAVWQKKTRETIVSIRALPIGGFVSMAGEADGDEVYPDVKVPEGRRLTDQKTWKRIVIMLAGVTMNFLLAWVVFSLVYLHVGFYQLSPKAVISEVTPGSPAERAGMMPGDRIVTVTDATGASIHPETFTELQALMPNEENAELQYEVDRGGTHYTFTVMPEYSEEHQRFLIGITSAPGEVIRLNFLNCWKYGLEEMKMMVRMLVETLKQVFTGKHMEQLSGPVGIYTATEEYVSLGWEYYLMLIAQLSLNVGIFNLLPLPVLDGGQVVIAAGEGIAHKPLNQKVKLILMGICWVLLLGMMVFVTWNDISRLLFK